MQENQFLCGSFPAVSGLSRLVHECVSVFISIFLVEKTTTPATQTLWFCPSRQDAKGNNPVNYG